MKKKGLLSSEKPLSAESIVDKFKKLQQKVFSNNEPKEALVEFVQFYAKNSLPLLFDATNLHNDLEELCWSNSCYTFWDDLIVSERYRSLLEIDDRHASYQLKPQSSLPSYLLIKGFFYYYRYSQLQANLRDPDHKNARRYLMKALSCYNFQAFCEYVYEIIRSIEEAIRLQQEKDLSVYLKCENNLHAIGTQYGAAGYIMLSNFYLALSMYYGKVEKNGQLFFKYLYDAYDAVIHAEIFEKYYYNDSYNALQGNKPASLLPRPFESVYLMKIHIKNTLTYSRGNMDKIWQVKREATKHAEKICSTLYREEYFTNESALAND